MALCNSKVNINFSESETTKVGGINPFGAVPRSIQPVDFSSIWRPQERYYYYTERRGFQKMSSDFVMPIEEVQEAETAVFETREEQPQEVGLTLPEKFELGIDMRKLGRVALEEKYDQLLTSYGACCHIYREVFSSPHHFVPLGRFPAKFSGELKGLGAFNALQTLFSDLLGAYNQVYEALESMDRIEEPYELRFPEKFKAFEESQKSEERIMPKGRNPEKFRERISDPKPVPAILPAPDPSLGVPDIPEDSEEELIDLGSAIEELLRDVVLNYGGSLDSLQILANCFAVTVFDPTFKKPIRVQIPGLTLKITPGRKSYFFRVTGDHEEISIKIKKRSIQLETDTSSNSDSEDSEA